MRLGSLTVTALAAALALPLAANAETVRYIAELAPLSGSGVSGQARLKLDTEAGTLGVRVRARGLAPDQLHIQHIHGTFGEDGTPSNAVTPTFAGGADADGDGIIELGEGIPFYGPILFNLSSDGHVHGPGHTPTHEGGADGFPTAPNGRIDFHQLYDLATTSAFGLNVLTEDPDDTFGIADLMPLSFREIVLHGGFLAAGQGSGLGEADGTAGYKLVLPVAAGEFTEIAPVPLPAAIWLLGAAVTGLGVAGTRRRRSA